VIQAADATARCHRGRLDQLLDQLAALALASRLLPEQTPAHAGSPVGPRSDPTIAVRDKEAKRMAHYLLQVAYTAEAWAALVKSPQNRLEAVRPVMQRLGGTLENAWLSFGEYDVVTVFQAPDNVSAAAFSMAISAAGAVKAVKTTPLMTFEEGMGAMRKAAQAEYEPPTDWGISYG
jgi:uncharacterized protein with GYD domain